MTDPLSVDVFVEDSAHERLLLAFLRRLAAERNCALRTQVLCARGGHSKAVHAMADTQRMLLGGGLQRPIADLFLVGIDGNCTTAAEKRRQIREACRPEFHDRLVIACPDPHVERWFMADPESFERVVDRRPKLGREKCERDHYKRLLGSTIAEAGHPAPLGGLEFADELVAAMDLYRACKNDAALSMFLDDLRAALARRS